MLGCVVCKEKRNKLFYIILNTFIYDFISCSAFVDIKQTLRYKLAINIIRHKYFLRIVPYVFSRIPSLDKIL